MNRDKKKKQIYFAFAIILIWIVCMHDDKMIMREKLVDKAQESKIESRESLSVFFFLNVQIK